MRFRIAIELNGVIRNINAQYLKYYLKDINPDANEDDYDAASISILPKLEFDSNSSKREFVYEDYPYEIFGCAAPMSRNLHVALNSWAEQWYWWGYQDDVAVFSLDEEELSIQSTYFYLSKSGTRVRQVVFPRYPENIWKNFDIVVTQDPRVAESKPNGKILVLISKSDNADVREKADLVYDSLEDLLKDDEFIKKCMIITKQNSDDESWVAKIKRFIKGLFNGRNK